MGRNFMNVINIMNNATTNAARLEAEITAMRNKPEDFEDEETKHLYDVLLGAARSLGQLMEIIGEKEF